MNFSIEKSAFDFEYLGNGCYLVSYTSQLTGNRWTNVVNDMELIDLTQNTEQPKKQHLHILKRLCKTGTKKGGKK